MDIRNRIGSLDDRIQSYMREQVYGQRSDGTYGNPVQGLMGEVFHQPRDVYARHPQGNIGLIASRGLQAGTVTAAGAGLINLSQRMAETFNNAADQQTDSTLYMN